MVYYLRYYKNDSTHQWNSYHLTSIQNRTEIYVDINGCNTKKLINVKKKKNAGNTDKSQNLAKVTVYENL